MSEHAPVESDSEQKYHFADKPLEEIQDWVKHLDGMIATEHSKGRFGEKSRPILEALKHRIVELARAESEMRETVRQLETQLKQDGKVEVEAMSKMFS